MKCYICDKDLSDKEIAYSEDLQGYEACSECLEIIYDTAYSDGFDKEDQGEIVVASIEDTDTTNVFSIDGDFVVFNNPKEGYVD